MPSTCLYFGPMMQVDEMHYENLTEEKIDRVLAELA
jgi:NADH:ubiquinone oxidoreductase subunit E